MSQQHPFEVARHAQLSLRAPEANLHVALSPRRFSKTSEAVALIVAVEGTVAATTAASDTATTIASSSSGIKPETGAERGTRDSAHDGPLHHRRQDLPRSSAGGHRRKHPRPKGPDCGPRGGVGYRASTIVAVVVITVNTAAGASAGAKAIPGAAASGHAATAAAATAPLGKSAKRGLSGGYHASRRPSRPPPS